MNHEVVAGVRPGSRILVVDDYEDAAESLSRLLKLHGYDVQTAHDGPGAIAAALGWRPDFVLLDLGLPGLEGYQVATVLRREASCREAVIIAVTGYGRPQDREQSRAAGIDHHLLKPVELDELLTLLARSEVVSS